MHGLSDLFESGHKLLIGVVHLRPLPGSPRWDGNRQKILDWAVADARAYESGGAHAVVIENFGDLPFAPGSVPLETVAAMAVAGQGVREAIGLPIGFNVLRNDAHAGLALCASCRGSFIRVNVLTGAMMADQGLIQGNAFGVMRLRRQLCPEAAVLADVHVKHAVPFANWPLAQAARDTLERGLADALIVSGSLHRTADGRGGCAESVPRSANIHWERNEAGERFGTARTCGWGDRGHIPEAKRAGGEPGGCQTGCRVSQGHTLATATMQTQLTNVDGPIPMLVHPSQFPEAVQKELLRGLSERRIAPKYHYESYTQTLKWLALHRQFAPVQKDPACEAMYRASFEQVARFWDRSVAAVHVIGLGCGGGEKDAVLVESLIGAGKQVTYTPVDVSPGMVVTSARRVSTYIRAQPGCPAQNTCTVTAGVVCDFEQVTDPASLVDGWTPPGALRLITFFGMLPNLDPATALPRLREWFRPGDGLLVSANLAPGEDYEAGMHQILPQYENVETTDWLLTLLLGLGCEPGDGEIHWSVERYAPDGGPKVMRFCAHYQFRKGRELVVWDKLFSFREGERIELFFSNRYTPERARSWLRRHSFRPVGEFDLPSGEEAVWLCLA